MDNSKELGPDRDKRLVNTVSRQPTIRWKAWILTYLFHVALVLPIAMLIGFVFDMALGRYYYWTRFRQLALCAIFMAGVSGFGVTLLRRQAAAIFVWVPPLFLLLYVGYSLATGWDSAWADSSRFQYVWNSLLGPNCTTQECVYTIPADIFLSGVAYSVGAAVALRIRNVNRSLHEVEKGL